MKKVFFALAIAGTILSAQTSAQGLLGKIKDKAKSADGGGGDNATTNVTDEWGISGSYFLSSPWDVSGKKVKKMVVEFVKEENGTIVNTLTLKVKDETGNFKLDEKVFNKQGLKLFKGGIFNESFDLMEIDKGVLFFNCTSKTGYIVLAKDEAALKTWDEETGLAKYEADKKKVNSAAAAGLRKKLDDYKAYKDNVGKIVFGSAQGTFNFQYKDKPEEDPSNFQTEWQTGNGLAMRAYFDKAFAEVCGACDGKVNYVLEMGKHKVDWMQLRGSSSAFSKMFIPSVGSNEYMTSAVWMWDGIDYNRALTMAIHKNIEDGSLKEGAKMNLKVTIYAYADRANGAKLAEGNVSVKYDPSSSSWKKRYSEFKDAVE